VGTAVLREPPLSGIHGSREIKWRSLIWKETFPTQRPMHTQFKCLAMMMPLVILGFGPLSITCLIGFYVVLARPIWFLTLVRNLYWRTSAVNPQVARQQSGNSFAARVKVSLSLLVLLILDIAPVPVTGVLGLFVIITRPPWFAELIEAIYADV